MRIPSGEYCNLDGINFCSANGVAVAMAETGVFIKVRQKIYMATEVLMLY